MLAQISAPTYKVSSFSDTCIVTGFVYKLSTTVAHKPHSELDSIYQGQEPKGKSILGFQAVIFQKNVSIN